MSFTYLPDVCVGIGTSLLVQVKILQKSLLVNRNARVQGSSVLAPNFDGLAHMELGCDHVDRAISDMVNGSAY